MSSVQLLWVGAACIGLAGLMAAFILVLPGRRSMSAERRLLVPPSDDGGLARTTRRATDIIGRAVSRTSWSDRVVYALDRAGMKRPLPEVVLMLGAAVLALIAIFWVVGNLVLGLISGVLLPLAFMVYVFVRADRRRRAFADQLDDLTQLLATNLRAGHSLLQSLSSLAIDVEDPARSELLRAVNQVRVGRDISGALDETARRMESEDFTWVAQAIAIHRNVGGNLADVLDTVSFTIRERNQVRRQVRALSAEGRLSALILMGLPVIVGMILVLVNPVYLATFTQSTLGFAMIGLIVLLMSIGSLWLWRIVQVKY